MIWPWSQDKKHWGVYFYPWRIRFSITRDAPMSHAAWFVEASNVIQAIRCKVYFHVPRAKLLIEFWKRFTLPKGSTRLVCAFVGNFRLQLSLLIESLPVTVRVGTGDPGGNWHNNPDQVFMWKTRKPVPISTVGWNTGSWDEIIFFLKTDWKLCNLLRNAWKSFLIFWNSFSRQLFLFSY